MKPLKLALIALCAVASTAASASVTQVPAGAKPAKVSTCYYEYSVITGDAIYDVYTCYGNGDGTA